MEILLKNVGSIGTADFKLSPGITAVIGPNGSGKSTLVNAIYFAFTGALLSGENISSIITRGCSKASITLKYKDITIFRELSTAGTGKVKFTRGDISLTRAREVESAICEYFGFSDVSILRLVFFAAQFVSVEFIGATPAARATMLTSLFGLVTLDKTRAEMQRAISEVDVSRVSADVISQLEQSLRTSESFRDQMLLKESETQGYLRTDDELDRLRRTVDAPLKGTRQECEASLSNMLLELQELRSSLDSMPTPPSPEDAEKYSAVMKHRELSAKLVADSEKLEEHRKLRELSSAEVSAYLDQLAANRAALVARRASVEERAQLLQSGKCPLTGGVPCPDLLARTDSKTLSDELSKIDSDIAQWDCDAKELKQLLVRSREFEATEAVLAASVADCERQLRSVELPEDFDTVEYERAAKGFDKTQETYRKLVTAIAAKESEISHYESQLAEMPTLEVSLEDRQAAQAELEAAVKAVNTMETLKQAVTNAESMVADQRSSLDFALAQNAQADRLGSRIAIVNKIRQALHRDNLPRMLLDDMLATLNRKLDSYLSRFNFPYTLVWGSGGSLSYSDSGAWYPASQLSGGQKYVVMMAMRCALADLLGVSFPLFVLDEPTTGLDVTNREALSAVLNGFSGSAMSEFIVIPTHDELLLPSAKIIKMGVDYGY